MTTPGKRNVVPDSQTEKLAVISAIHCPRLIPLTVGWSCLPSLSSTQQGFLEGGESRKADTATARRGKPPARFAIGFWVHCHGYGTHAASKLTDRRAVDFLSSEIERLFHSSAKVSVLIVGEVSCLPPILARFQRHIALG